MTETNATARTSVTYTFTFDPSYDWTWTNQLRHVLTHPADRELFDLCADLGAHLLPWVLLVHMRETLDYTPEELVRPADWIRVMELVHAHADDPRAARFEQFAHHIEGYLASITDDGIVSPTADIVDPSNQRAGPAPSSACATSSTSSTARRS